jgi:hypothetical protein
VACVRQKHTYHSDNCRNPPLALALFTQTHCHQWQKQRFLFHLFRRRVRKQTLMLQSESVTYCAPTITNVSGSECCGCGTLRLYMHWHVNLHSLARHRSNDEWVLGVYWRSNRACHLPATRAADDGPSASTDKLGRPQMRIKCRLEFCSRGRRVCKKRGWLGISK